MTLQGLGQLGFTDLQPATQLVQLAAGHGVQAIRGDAQCQCPGGRPGVELFELNADALGQVAGTDTGRVQGLDPGQGPLDFQ